MLAAFLLTACAPPPDDRGLVLYVDSDEIVVQHDTLIGTRLAPDVEIYVHHGVATSPGDLADLWIARDAAGQGTITRATVRGEAPLPARHRPEGSPLTGVVIRSDATALLVDHDPVPGLMGAMVMPFDVTRATAAAIHPGDRITARVVVSDYGHVLADVVRTGTEAVSGPTDAPLRIGEVLPRVVLDGPGGPVVLGEGQGRPTLVAFVYTTCPDPTYCPATVARLAGLQADLPAGARIVAVTIDPETDTDEVLAAYAAQVGADPDRWVFARPTPLQLHPLAVAAGLTVSVRSGRISHSTRLLVLDAGGRLVARYEDNGFDADEVLSHLASGSG